jgi:ketosteroid isomerase-like protein
MKSRGRRATDDIRAEYDFDYRKAVRGKHFHRLVKEGSNIVVLDPDVAQRFRTSAAVNEALRKLLRASRTTPRAAPRSAGHERRKTRSVRR